MKKLSFFLIYSSFTLASELSFQGFSGLLNTPNAQVIDDGTARNRIRIIAKEGGKYKIRTLDMSKLSTLNIDNLVLKHNSIVYVEPRSSKAIKVGVQDYLPIIQAISGMASTFLAIDYISNGDKNE